MAMPRRARAGGSSRSATRLRAPRGSPAASARAAEAARESMFGRIHVLVLGVNLEAEGDRSIVRRQVVAGPRGATIAYSTTSTARNSIDRGRARPSAFAVLPLMTR